MSNLGLLLQQQYVAAAAIIPPIAAVILQATVDAKSRHLSRSKVGATQKYGIVLYTISVVAGIIYISQFNDLNIYAIAFPIQSIIMLAVFFAAPVLHRKSGFVPAETQIRLHGMGNQQQKVFSFLQTHFQRQGLLTYPGEKIGCTLVAVVGKVDARAFAGKHRRYRVFVTLEPTGDDLRMCATADVKEYVLQDSWETSLTTQAIRALEQNVVSEYGQIVEIANAVPIGPPLLPLPLHKYKGPTVRKSYILPIAVLAITALCVLAWNIGSKRRLASVSEPEVHFSDKLQESYAAEFIPKVSQDLGHSFVANGVRLLLQSSENAYPLPLWDKLATVPLQEDADALLQFLRDASGTNTTGVVQLSLSDPQYGEPPGQLTLFAGGANPAIHNSTFATAVEQAIIGQSEGVQEWARYYVNIGYLGLIVLQYLSPVQLAEQSPENINPENGTLYTVGLEDNMNFYIGLRTGSEFVPTLEWN